MEKVTLLNFHYFTSIVGKWIIMQHFHKISPERGKIEKLKNRHYLEAIHIT